MAQRIRKGDYGLVQVVKGPHAGRMGYYDDEDDDEINAVVYFSTPLQDGAVVMPRRWLRTTDVLPLELAQWAREHPEMVARVDIALP